MTTAMSAWTTRATPEGHLLLGLQQRLPDRYRREPARDEGVRAYEAQEQYSDSARGVAGVGRVYGSQIRDWGSVRIGWEAGTPSPFTFKGSDDAEHRLRPRRTGLRSWRNCRFPRRHTQAVRPVSVRPSATSHCPAPTKSCPAPSPAPANWTSISTRCGGAIFWRFQAEVGAGRKPRAQWDSCPAATPTTGLSPSQTEPKQVNPEAYVAHRGRLWRICFRRPAPPRILGGCLSRRTIHGTDQRGVRQFAAGGQSGSAGATFALSLGSTGHSDRRIRSPPGWG